VIRFSTRPPPLVLLVFLLACPLARADKEPAGWKKAEAGKYLDERARAWFEYGGAARGEGATRTTCLSCHTLVPYALARPVLRKLSGADQPAENEQKLLAQTTKRVEAWSDLDTPQYRLLYDFNDVKKKESRGTEAILNALILAFDDRYQGRTAPSDATRKAFANLWSLQIQTGDHKGSWDWFDFGMEPWESKGSRYQGAVQAALAIGTAPGYLKPGADPDTDARIDLLRSYLKEGLPGQNLFNRAWALWASTQLNGILTREEQQTIIRQLFDQQREDGGWNLAALGAFVRHDGTAQETGSDGYATGLILHVLQTAGVPKNDPRIAQGLSWLLANQTASGAWISSSVNKKRDPTTHAGKFMSDAATAYAVLALSHP
jgi:squalene-hopene/tetraprenyl-beta-curcumene cyclase